MALLSKEQRIGPRVGRYNWLLALAMLLAGCETVVELELPDPKPLLVINSVINPDSLFAVRVNASRSIFSNQPHPLVENAVVQVYQAGQLVETLPRVSSGRYRGTGRPQPQQPYELRVSAPDYPSARATTELPTKPALSEVRATRVPSSNPGFQTVEASFVLADDAGQDNFYYIQAYTPDTDRFNNNRPYNRTVSISWLAPFEPEFSVESRTFFSDRLFDGQLLRLRLQLENNASQTTYVRVCRVTRAYYEYARTLENQSYGDNVLTSPAPVANNIQGGLGLFGSYSASVIAVRP